MRASLYRVALGLVVVGSLPSLACDYGPSGPVCAYTTRAAAVFVGTVAFSDHDPALGLRQRTLSSSMWKKHSRESRPKCARSGLIRADLLPAMRSTPSVSAYLSSPMAAVEQSLQ